VASKDLGVGAVALVDCLGFKGIWSRVDPGALFAQMKSLRKEALEYTGAGNFVIGTHRYLRNEIRFMSDTVIVTCRISKEWKSAQAPYEAIYRVSQITSLLVQLALCSAIPLSYRGCITFGDFLIDSQFLLGPAIDEAASLEREAEGAFVWLAPSALRQFNNRIDESLVRHLEPGEMLPWHVPMKNGRTYETLALNLGLTHSRDDKWDQAVSGLESSFNPNSRSLPLEIEIKRQNTMRYIAYLQQCRNDIKHAFDTSSGYSYGAGRFEPIPEERRINFGLAQ
jgi:hypothetical protein